MRSVEDVIMALGGAPSISNELGIYRNAAHKWEVRVIPSKYASWVSAQTSIPTSELPTSERKTSLLEKVASSAKTSLE